MLRGKGGLMSVIVIVMPVALGIAGLALLAFVWAVRRGEYDDLDSPPVRMLHDDRE